MGRPRSFDHEAAQLLRDSGVRVSVIAEMFGVSDAAIRYATDPKVRARMRERSDRYQKSGVCPKCGGQSTRRTVLVSYLCRACSNRKRATTVRAAELQCVTCHKWLPDSAFPHNRNDQHRRGRHGQCSACQTQAKQAYREKHKLPCATCGEPALPANENRNPQGLPRCRACFHADQRKARREKAAA